MYKKLKLKLQINIVLFKESMNTIYAGVGPTISKGNKPQDGKAYSQLANSADKTSQDPTQPYKSHGKLRITRTRDQNTRNVIYSSQG